MRTPPTPSKLRSVRVTDMTGRLAGGAPAAYFSGLTLSVVLRKLPDVTVLAVDGSSAEDAFLADAQRYRRELLAHCYRMTGSLHDAEDLVQETYLRAWKSYKNFQGKSSVRTWLYRIATNTCLTALDSRQRRPLPTGL